MMRTICDCCLCIVVRTAHYELLLEEARPTDSFPVAQLRNYVWAASGSTAISMSSYLCTLAAAVNTLEGFIAAGELTGQFNDSRLVQTKHPGSLKRLMGCHGETCRRR